MNSLRIITPVKDSILTTQDTLRAIAAGLPAEVACRVIVYNDNSTDENTVLLRQLCDELHFQLVNLSDLTDHPSPNYLFVLQREQQICLEEGSALLIVESDVTVRPDTISLLLSEADRHPGAGIVASVTVDEEGRVNYPYQYAAKWSSHLPAEGDDSRPIQAAQDSPTGGTGGAIDNKRHCSFCCSLLTPALLRAFDFHQLDPTKNWFDVTISHESLKAELHNYLLMNAPVLHRPHQSRPWKLLKYKNPLLYYWRKLTRGFDKI